MTGHTGALPDWNAIDWHKAWRQVRRPGTRVRVMRIAKAVMEGRPGRVNALQRLLTRSCYAKLLAVKRVTSNKGRNTTGVDGILWKDGHVKIQAALSLHRRGYKAQPLRRVYIPKKKGKTSVEHSHHVRQDHADTLQACPGPCSRNDG